MDENTWRLAQFIMMLFGIQTTVLVAAFGFIWSRLNKIEIRLDKIEDRITKLDDKVNALDKRLAIVETLLHMKECCVLKDDSQVKKAE